MNADAVIRPVRMVKSAPEVVRMRRVADLGRETLARLTPRLRPGLTERDVSRRLHGLLGELAADTVPYLVPVSGAHGCEQVNMGPTDRRLETGTPRHRRRCHVELSPPTTRPSSSRAWSSP